MEKKFHGHILQVIAGIPRHGIHNKENRATVLSADTNPLPHYFAAPDFLVSALVLYITVLP
jgi:hypothetical protein